MTATRGVVFTSSRHAEVQSVDVATPREGQVTIHTLLSLISAGTEMNFYRGETDEGTRRRLLESGTIDNIGPFPMRFGYQTVGVVEDAPGDGPYRIGDVVFAKGPHQERHTADVSRVFPLPPGVELRAGVLGNLGSVALQALLDVPVRLGDCVVVLGLGVIGTMIAHMARRTAGTLILVDPVSERRARASDVGADAVVSPDDAPEAVERASAGRQADVTFEVSGAPSALQAALELTGVEGTICVPAYYGTKSVPLVLDPEFHTRRHRIVSSQVAMVGSGLQPRWDTRRRMDTAMRLVAGIGSHRLISHEVELENAPQAYEMIDERPAEALGIVITYGNGNV